MKTIIKNNICLALRELNAPDDLKIIISKPKSADFGDFSSNIAFLLAKYLKKPPLETAKIIIKRLPKIKQLKKTEVAGKGFINFFLAGSTQVEVINQILSEKKMFGRKSAKNLKICLEFVSANPTGPLHVGHGRGAAFGASLVNILKAAGFSVFTEYYVNDAGRQMDILALSVWLRYLELDGIEVNFPVNCYQGDYIWDIGSYLHHKFNNLFVLKPDEIFLGVTPDEPAGGDKEKHVDELIKNLKLKLGVDYRKILAAALGLILDNIKSDLKSFGLQFDNWYFESNLKESTDKVMQKLESKGEVYVQNGAKWFRSADYNDEKDRVVIRDNGSPTYFASDIAYHNDKFYRGFDRLINIWGSDHHGYIDRVKAGIEACGYDKDKLAIILVQFAILYRGGEKIPMSTRGGSYVTLRELYEEIGVDAARFFYVLRKHEQALDFDLELAKAHNLDNPVYYVQYAHARVFSIMKKLGRKNYKWRPDKAELSLLTESMEKTLLSELAHYPEIIVKSAQGYAPHLLAQFLRDIASAFHSYYNASTIIVADEKLRNARLSLANAVAQVIANGLELLGVSAPEQM